MKKPEPTLESNPKEWLSARLSNKSELVRRTALEEVEKLGPAGVDLVLNVVRDEAAKRRKQRRCMKWGLGIYFGVIGLVMIVWVGHGLITGHWSKFPNILQLFTSFSALSAYAAASVTQKAGTTWLAQFKDPRLAAPLVDALSAEDKNLREVAQSALIGLLPLLTRDEVDVLSAEQRAVLRANLKPQNKELSAAILRALPVISDTAAIPSVQTFIQRVRNSKKQDPELLVAAESTHTALIALKEHERDKETLLRPAESASETLLRPSVSMSESDPAALLRPASFG